MYKISDYCLACYILKSACKQYGKPFTDLEIRFDEDFFGLKNGVIYTGSSAKLTQTLYNIIYVYLDNFEKICGIELFKDNEQKKNILLMLSNFLRGLGYLSKSLPEAQSDEPVVQRLYQYTLVWLLMKDIVCPAYDIQLKNTKICLAHNPVIDVSFFKKSEDEEKEDFIFVNADIVYEPCRYAYLFIETLKSYELYANKIVEEIISSDLNEKLIGTLKLVFNDDKMVEDFMTILMACANVENKIEQMVYNFQEVKTAQFTSEFGNSYGSWWYLGLIEKMLEPSRGPDWTAYQMWEPLRKELWNKIEHRRKKAGRDGLNYEALLREQSGETPKEKIKVIEKMLSSNRIW